MKSNKDNINPSILGNNLNLKKIIGTYLKQWPWFLLSCFLFILFAVIHLRYATPEYNANAKIMLLDKNGGASPAQAVLNGLGMMSNFQIEMIEDEIEILKSRRLMTGVVKNLGLNKQIFNQGRIQNFEFYPIEKAPIKINFIGSDSIVYNSAIKFEILITSATTFDFIQKTDSKEENITKNLSFGKNIQTHMGDIVVTPNTMNISKVIKQTFIIEVTPLDIVAQKLIDKIRISSAADGSKVINVSLNDPSVNKAKAIINNLIEEYNRVSVEEKSLMSINTADFINKRIDLIETDLSQVDDQIERFKTGNKLTNITSEADLFLNSSALTEQQLAENRMEFSKIDYMKNQLSDNGFERIPGNIGLADGTINSIASKYNELLDDRDRLLKSSNEKNPIIVNLDQQLNTLKSNLKGTLDNSAKTINLQIRSLENQSSKISSKIYAVPGQVRKSRDIEREQGIKESLYLYLLQKREEATISQISTAPNAKIIDVAHSNNKPVSPKRIMIYLASLIFGIGVPFGFIYTKELLDTKIHSKEDLENEIKNITVLGEIPKISKSDKNLIERNDRSIFSESFRIIRTNFDFVKRGRNTINYNNVVFVTSTINGEGKSFFSMNLALTMANTDQKVLLIGADIRKPQIFPALQKIVKKSIPKIGLTEYLVDKSIIIGETIYEYNINNIKIDILLSGKTPPNPAELLMNKRVKELFDSVSKQYDYVIVDTAPSMLVTDTLLISEYAGHTIYLTRAGYTEKNLLNFTKELHKNNKLNGMMLVVNDVKQSNFGYGAKYGYYGATEKKSWFGIKKSK